ncbi:MAG: glycosyltransferase family 4 protein [Acidobacteriota bacterium]|nr:glycosyltransferase family 4 protein [Acidobacteriota bacterium]
MGDRQIHRILMTTDTVGGVWTFTRELVRELSERGIEVVLAALGGAPSEAQAAEIADIRGACLLAGDFKLEWMEDPWSDVAESGRWLLDVEREYGPDLVHLNSFGHGALAWKTPGIMTAHSCVLSWWRAVRGEPAPASWNRYREVVTGSLKAVDAVTAPSHAMARTLAENYQFAQDSCAVIPNGRTMLSTHASVAKQPLIFSAGRLWDQAKNAAALADVANKLAWPVYLAGEAGTPGFGGCHLLGRLKESAMTEWYAKAAIYALPARYEPFGLSVLEAALSRCALVLGDIPSLRELWDGCALFVPPDDRKGLREALQELIGKPALGAQMARLSYDRGLTYKSARMAEGYLAVYQRAGQCVS